MQPRILGDIKDQKMGPEKCDPQLPDNWEKTSGKFYIKQNEENAYAKDGTR